MGRRKNDCQGCQSAKAILDGSSVCIDQKCKSSQQTDLTPVTVTSNTDMGVVMDGNSITFEYQQPLEDQIFKFELVCQLYHDFRKITKTEIKEFFAWAKASECGVTREFNVKRVEAKKRSTPSAENISLSKRGQTSFEIQTSREPEVLDFSSWYVSKCSQHLNLTQMMFPCKNWERLNQKSDICFTHGVSDCEQCFPKVRSDSGLIQKLHTKHSQIHTLQWDTPFASTVCDGFNVDFDNCNEMSQVVMSLVAHPPAWLEKAGCALAEFFHLEARPPKPKANQQIKTTPEGLLFLDTNILDHLTV